MIISASKPGALYFLSATHTDIINIKHMRHISFDD